MADYPISFKPIPSVTLLPRQFREFCCEDDTPTMVVRFRSGAEDVGGRFSVVGTLGKTVLYSNENLIKVQSIQEQTKKLYIVTDSDFSVVDVFNYIFKSGQYGVCLSDMLCSIYKYNIMQREGILIHASVVAIDGYAIAFSGPSGIGKSTQANLWCRKYREAAVVNYDKPFIIKNEGRVFIGGTPWSGKEDCYKKQMYPLKAIVFLEKANVNSIEKLSKRDALAHMYLNYFAYPINEIIDNKYRELLFEYSCTIECYRLLCTVSEEAVDITFNEVFKQNEGLADEN